MSNSEGAATERNLYQSLYSELGVAGLVVCLIAIQFLDLQFLAPKLYRSAQHWYLSSLFEISIVCMIVAVQKPFIFKGSKWTFTVTDFVIGVASGGLLSLLIRLAYRDPVPDDRLFLGLAIFVMPVIEEFFFRGVIVRSLLARHSSWVVVSAVALLAAFFHRDFRIAFVQQAILNLVYLVRGHSLFASIACHISMSAVLLLPATWVGLT